MTPGRRNRVEPSASTLSWLTSAIGSEARVLRRRPLPGASHTNDHVTIQTRAGRAIEVLLRRFTDVDRLLSDPWYEPGAELEALRAVSTVDAPVPHVLAEDVEAVECDVPTLVLEWLPGEPAGHVGDHARFVQELANPLPRIHGARSSDVRRGYEPYFASHGLTPADLGPPRWSRRPTMWSRVADALRGGAPEGPRAFIHRDYHHGNTVWSEGALSGIIDWTAGCVGPPGIDLAHMRINLVWDFDLETADRFLNAWRSIADGAGYHPYWDLLDAIDFLGSGAGEGTDPQVLERHEAFIERALAELG